MAGTIEISTINVISPNGLVTKPLTVDNYGYAKIGDERVGVTPQNWIINGQFDVWQRGTSQTSKGYGSDDRWANEHQTSTKAHSQMLFSSGQTDVPNNPKYFSRTIITTGGTSESCVVKSQFIEDVEKLAGKYITLSFWAKADSNKNISIEGYQHFGAGGSADYYQWGVQKFSLTSTWKRFTKTILVPSIYGKTVGSGSCTGLLFWFEAGSEFNSSTDSLGNQSGTFDIANVCLVEGSIPQECPNEPYAEVLRKCQRYYVKFITNNGTMMIAPAIANKSTQSYFTCSLPIEMRIAPTAVEYSNDLVFWKLGVGTYAISSLAISISNPKIAGIEATNASGLTVRDVGFVMTSIAGGYIAFSAEL